jgi:hypothetical protein
MIKFDIIYVFETIVIVILFLYFLCYVICAGNNFDTEFWKVQ